MKRIRSFLLMLALFCLIPPSTFAAAPTALPSPYGYRLLIYYGIPIGANDTWNADKAAKALAQYDVVVFGAGLEEEKHSYHHSTQTVISLMRQNNPKLKLFGYIDLGVATDNHDMKTILAKSAKWKALGADGIFLDDAGYDFGVSRQRLNDAVNGIHELGMSVFVNAWRPEDVLSDAVNKKYNPNGLPSALDERDIYLLEDFLQPTDINEPGSASVFTKEFRAKIDKALKFRSERGIHLMSVSTIDWNAYSATAIRKFFRMNEAAAGIFALEAYGVSPDHYSSSRPSQNVVPKLPYMLNYKAFLTSRTPYTAKYGDRDFASGGFRLHSLPGEHYYQFPSTAIFE